MASEEFDIVLFGASGFTGKHCVIQLAEVCKENPGLKWAVAGRNEEKLRNVVDWAERKTGVNLKQVGYVSADVSDVASLDAMCRRGKLLLNLVGPYRFYGVPVVEACIRNKCHHIDISGEIQFLEKLQLDYHETAKKAGVYIVEACGFDSIPSDLGVLFVKKQFPGILNSVEGYQASHHGPEGTTLNFGTLNSAVHVVANRNEIKEIRERFHYAPLPECKPKLKPRGPLFYSDICGGWCIPLNSTDASVVNRSQRYLYETKKERPVQYRQSYTRRSFLSLMSFIFVMINIGILSIFRCGRKLLSKYPKMFTFGVFSHEGPTEAQMATTSFTFTFRGRGFSSKSVEKSGKEDMAIITQVCGPEMAYVTTPIGMIQAGLTILKETSYLPDRGGVYTPAAAFHRTSLIDRCHKHGIKFSVIRAAHKI
ncbi:saccharopine dehydrogenase-like oxidoreductase isoform X1 [Apostichopus japonicus]|uniref:saccharopine dehydrogenase-like oxidoreductase isoform X1 n=1 Tax=Stichopus japonicus TaxID=307972 RepID=UPI003AB13B6D